MLRSQINLCYNTTNMAATWRMWQLSKCCHLVVPSQVTQVSHGKWGVAYSLGYAHRFMSGRSQLVDWIYYCTRVWRVDRQFFELFWGGGGILTSVWLTFSRLMTYIYICRTSPLNSRCCILYICSTNIRTEYFKHAAHSPFFPLQNAVYFIMLPFSVPVLFTF